MTFEIDSDGASMCESHSDMDRRSRSTHLEAQFLELKRLVECVMRDARNQRIYMTYIYYTWGLSVLREGRSKGWGARVK